ncbi:cytochrome-c peroxidase [Jannaschia sp. CCS1]|uniref:cytochrome-c peroxidase n=1 Tax=Jannaschia sp. (strain CCS1) TaxID=290400 RepID=UPI0020C7515D|nr:cytochrome c peroxidase [Jannaschia sp. CCS1]
MTDLSHSLRASASLRITTAAVLLMGTAAGGTDLPHPLADTDFLYDGAPSEALFALGRDLFFDPILSGNRNISCGTCHDPAHGSGDGLALGFGTGGEGFGPDRHAGTGVTARVPRNAQPLWNIGAREYVAMFHDGRLEPDPDGPFPSGYWSPAREELPEGLDSLLAAQAMFPVLSPVEMAGWSGSNPVGTAVAQDRAPDAWDLIAERLQELPEYAAQFEAAFDDVTEPEHITFTHAARALAAFQTTAFRSTDSPFDTALQANDLSVLSPDAQRGAALFYGDAACAGCHSGPLLTDHGFHAIAVPQIGPGKGHGADTTYFAASGFPDRLEDEGRFRVTFDPDDLFRFRTPSLRNVTLTGPWGHSGAFDDLEQMVRHHLDAVASLETYEVQPDTLPAFETIITRRGAGSTLIFENLNPFRAGAFAARDGFVQASDQLRTRIAAASAIEPIALSDREIADLMTFLATFTDPTAHNRSDLVPATVPSGLAPQPTPQPQGVAD